MTCIQGSGNLSSESREILNFKKITININAVVHIQQNGKYNVSIEAEDNILPYIRTTLKRDELIISSKRCFIKHKPIHIFVTSPEFKKITLTSSGKIIGENILNSSNLEIELSGSGKIDIELNVDKLTTQLFGSGKITYTGNVSHHRILLSGSGIINANELESDNTIVNLSGSGICRINAKEKLKIIISGSGFVEYSGSPEIESNISGSGRIKKIKL